MLVPIVQFSSAVYLEKFLSHINWSWLCMIPIFNLCTTWIGIVIQRRLVARELNNVCLLVMFTSLLWPSANECTVQVGKPRFGILHLVLNFILD